jgi:hypothetical protein
MGLFQNTDRDTYHTVVQSLVYYSRQLDALGLVLLSTGVASSTRRSTYTHYRDGAHRGLFHYS